MKVILQEATSYDAGLEIEWDYGQTLKLRTTNPNRSGSDDSPETTTVVLNEQLLFDAATLFHNHCERRQ